jgi:hypothetical protein
VAVNVPAQRNRYVSGQVGVADHVWTETEGEVAWPAGRSFDALMKAQNANVSGYVVAIQTSDCFRKPAANVVSVRETHERDAYSACFEDESAWLVEDVQAFVQRQQRKGHAAAFVVPRHEQNWNSRVGNALERRECRFGEPRRDAAAIQQVTAVDNHIDLAASRRFERSLEILKEVVASSSANDARATGQVKTKVCVGNE